MQTYLDAYKAKTESIYSVQKDGTQYKLNVEFTSGEAPFKLVFSDETPGKPSPTGPLAGKVEQIGNTQNNTIYINMGYNFGNGDVSPQVNTYDLDFSAETFARNLKGLQ